MLIEDKFYVKYPIKKLWDFLLDPKNVGHCIPGCESVEPVSETEYNSVIKAKVGFIAVRFKIKTFIEEIVPYSLIRTAGEGNEFTKLGRFKQKTTIKFNELSEEETEVIYQTDVSVVGRLATFGNRIMKAKAKALGKEFADAVKKKIGVS